MTQLVQEQHLVPGTPEQQGFTAGSGYRPGFQQFSDMFCWVDVEDDDGTAAAACIGQGSNEVHAQVPVPGKVGPEQNDLVLNGRCLCGGDDHRFRHQRAAFRSPQQIAPLIEQIHAIERKLFGEFPESVLQQGSCWPRYRYRASGDRVHCQQG